MSALDQIAGKIIKEQELVIGPLAWLEARKVPGIEVVNQRSGEVHLTDGNGAGVVDSLVSRYERIFGPASHEVCREAAASLIADLPPSDVPASLR